MHDFESWEDHYDLHDRRDYLGLVEYCKNEVSQSPKDFYAAERLMAAFVLNGDFTDAIDYGLKLQCDLPGTTMYSHHILDALFAVGKTEDDFDWAIRPTVLRLDKRIIDDCYEFLRPKRKPRKIADFHLELWIDVYTAFTDDDLLERIRNDPRFVVEGTCAIIAELNVVRKRKSKTP